MKISPSIRIAALAGVVAGAAVNAIPVTMLEWASASSGLSELVPAAAPPLGSTFRALMSGGAGVLTMALAALMLPGSPQDDNKKDRKMGFALKKIAIFGRHRQENRDDAIAAPALRRADSHPDAPARAPLVVSRDLAEEVARLAPPIVEDDEPVDGPPTLVFTPIEPEPETIPEDQLVMPRAPDPLPWEAIKEEIVRMQASTPQSAYVPPVTEVAATPADASAPMRLRSVALPVDGRPLSIAELTERFEAGLERRRITAIPAPEGTATPAAPTPQAEVEATGQDGDDALQTALATLRGITARAG